MNAIYLGVFWMLYYALHSALAAEPAKRFFKTVFPSVYPHYRAMYSVIAVVNFVLLGALHFRASSPDVFETGYLLQTLGLVFGFAGAVILAAAIKQYGASFLVVSEEYTEDDEPRLVTTGLNAYVRHPLYFGILLLTVFLILFMPSEKNIAFSVITAIYIFLGSLHEEQRLIAQYGNAYKEYRKRVKMLIPYVF